MRTYPHNSRRRAGLSLAEVLAALVISAMLMIAVLALHRRIERAAAAVHRRIDDSRLPAEILQRIAEDLDQLVSSGSDIKIRFENKYIQGYPAAKLTVVRTVTDSKNEEIVLEEIIWQSSFDIDSDRDGLVLYRGHSGITAEDKLLDDQRADWEKGYPMVPICSGITLFKISVPGGDKPVEKWTSDTPPKGVRVLISFAEPVKTESEEYEIADTGAASRTIAIDRTRKINFELNAPASVPTTSPDAVPTTAPDTGPATTPPGAPNPSTPRTGSNREGRGPI